MKKNKQLQKIADQSLEKYKDQDFLDSLKNKIECKKSEVKTKKKFIPYMAFASAVAVVVIVVLCVLLINPPSNGSDGDHSINNKKPDSYYSSGDDSYVNSSIESINAAISDMELVVSEEGFVCNEAKCHVDDNSPNIVLYYKVQITCDDGYADYYLVDFNLDIVTNSNYNHTFTHAQYNKSLNFKAYTINYVETEEVYDEGLLQYTIKGEMITENEKYYFTFSSVSEDESGFDTIIGVLLN